MEGKLTSSFSGAVCLLVGCAAFRSLEGFSFSCWQSKELKVGEEKSPSVRGYQELKGFTVADHINQHTNFKSEGVLYTNLVFFCPVHLPSRIFRAAIGDGVLDKWMHIHRDSLYPYLNSFLANGSSYFLSRSVDYST